jgi:UDP-N-acetylmuramoylalanine--D-glutamate ligase
VRRALVIGLGVTATAVVRQLTRRGVDVVVVDDKPTDAARSLAGELGASRYVDGDSADVPALVDAADVVSPSPGVALRHPVIARALATGVPVWSEFEWAAEWDDRPIVAVTGTNGKTTVTTLVELMLTQAGRKVVSAGNNDLPLVDALDDPAVELFVVEASSFRLQFTERFRPIVGTWLNVSPDHLDWHPSVDHYADAKARMWARQRGDDLAIGNLDDELVMNHLADAPARRATFGLASGDWHATDGTLVAPDGTAIMRVDELPRALPHDVSNSLAAAATAISAGASIADAATVLRAFQGLPHRVQLVRDAGGVRWYDDSKATTPASVVAAVSGFPSVVLIAGGKNKGLDLYGLRELAPHLRAVIAIGQAAPAVVDAFTGAVPVATADSMDKAVELAAARAQPGDAVVLSPGCASQDWYRNYGERGDDFARAARMLGADETTP